MSKIKHKLAVKHKNPLKVRKQKIIDRINACNTEDEIAGYEKTLAYHSVLSKDFDWDQGFFFDLIEFKLKRMAEYFHTHNIVENEKEYGRQCDKAIAILNAGYKTNIVLSEDLKEIYVNPRNIHRFVNPKTMDFIIKEGLRKYYLATVREYKAKALFWKYLYHYIEYWWD